MNHLSKKERRQMDAMWAGMMGLTAAAMMPGHRLFRSVPPRRFMIEDPERTLRPALPVSRTQRRRLPRSKR